MTDVPVTYVDGADSRRDEAAKIVDWRMEFAIELGYAPEVAARIARTPSHELDMHRLDDLIAGGCSRELALEILS